MSSVEMLMLIQKFNSTTGESVYDTLKTIAGNDGSFNFNGNIPNVPALAQIKANDKKWRNYVVAFLEKGNIHVAGHVDSLDDVKVTGTYQNNLYQANREAESLMYKQINGLLAKEKLLPVADSAQKSALVQEADVIRRKIYSDRETFIQKYPDAICGAIYLYVLQSRIAPEKVEALYNRLTGTAKYNSYAHIVKEHIIAEHRTAIGNQAPSFKATDLSGVSFTPENYKGKYLLLEFWASWCVPCRAENPHLLEMYKKYQPNGFEIVGITLDESTEKWKEAIEKDKLIWRHIASEKGFGNPIAKLYGVQPIPDNFLIGPDGKIIAKNLRSKELEEKLKKIFAAP